MSDLSQSIPPSEPALRKGWWLGRITIAMAATMTAVVATRFVTVWVTDRQTARLMSELKAQGLPTRPEELQPPALPDSENAAIVWRQAFNLVDQTVDSPRTSTFSEGELGWYPPYTWRWHQLATANEKANGPAMALALQAAKLPSADWGIRYVSPLNKTSLKHLRLIRDMASRLTDSAQADLIRGDANTGLQKLRATLILALHCRTDPILVSQFVAIGIDSLTCTVLRTHVRSICLQPTSGGLSTDHLQRLIDLLLDPSGERDLVRSMSGEILIQRETLGGESTSGLTQAIWKRGIDRVTRRQQEIVRVLQMPADPRRQSAAIAPNRRGEDAADRLSRHLDNIYEGDYSRIPFVQGNLLAQRRVAAIALAVRWYGLEQGHYPQSLDVLVPKYLPAIPENPFAPTPFEYQLIKAGRPDGGDRPVLYLDLGDGVRGTLPALPEYEVYFDGGRNIRGRVSDLIGWNATQAEVDAAERR